ATAVRIPGTTIGPPTAEPEVALTTRRLGPLKVTNPRLLTGFTATAAGPAPTRTSAPSAAPVLALRTWSPPIGLVTRTVLAASLTSTPCGVAAPRGTVV